MAKILIVDDSKINRLILMKGLQQKDFVVFEATSGREAIELAQKELPDIILMDLMMPELSGEETLQILKKDPKTQAIPTIAQTAKNKEQDVQKCFDIGFDDYLSKPISIPELIQKIQRLVNN